MDAHEYAATDKEMLAKHYVSPRNRDIAAMFAELPIVSITTFMENKDKSGAVLASLVFDMAYILIGSLQTREQQQERRAFLAACGVHPDDLPEVDVD